MFFSLSLQSYYVSSRVIRLHLLKDTERLHDVIINLNNKIICAYAISTYLTNMNKCQLTHNHFTSSTVML
jgi:hypothetical protein